MNKNSSNIIKEVLLAFAMGIIFLAVLIALSYIIFPNQMTEGENTEELLLIGFPMLIAYITYYARKILNKIKLTLILKEAVQNRIASFLIPKPN